MVILTCVHNNQAWSNSSGLWRQSFAMLSCVGLLVILIASEKKFLASYFFVSNQRKKIKKNNINNKKNRKWQKTINKKQSTTVVLVITRHAANREVQHDVYGKQETATWLFTFGVFHFLHFRAYFWGYRESMDGSITNSGKKKKLFPTNCFKGEISKTFKIRSTSGFYLIK